jgi:uncharacterized membrane protein
METTTPAQPQPPAATGEDKTVAIVAYITLIGFIAAVVIHSNKKTKLGAFHLRQTLGLFLTSLLCIIPFLNLILIPIILVLWIFGLIAAINGEMKPMPVIGPMYQKWFGNTFD